MGKEFPITFGKFTFRSLEVYTYSESLGKPKLLFKRSVNESIQSLGHGYVTNPEKEDIILGTHSGKIISFTQAAAVGFIK